MVRALPASVHEPLLCRGSREWAPRYDWSPRWDVRRRRRIPCSTAASRLKLGLERGVFDGLFEMDPEGTPRQVEA
jgi:hypothetical protein